MLARKEVELLRQGEKFVNQALVLSFPERSLESIKGKRKQPAYRALVQEFLRSVQSNSDDSIEPSADTNMANINVGTNYEIAILNYINSLNQPAHVDFQIDRLLQISFSLQTASKDDVLQNLTLYLRAVFPMKAYKSVSKKCVDPPMNLSRKQARRVEYARTQDLWRKNRSKCIRMLLDDVSEVRVFSKDVMINFWDTLFTQNPVVSPGAEKSRPTIEELWAPITPIEVKRSWPPNTTSSGPDGLSARLLRKVPMDVLVRILNLILWCGKAPTYLLELLTIMIPKKKKASLPSDFRPITVSSVLIRTFHKILATRMAHYIELDSRQRAFRPTDGFSDNVFLLDMILRYHHKHHKPLYIASLDIAKAFDSVSHSAVYET